MGQPVKDLYHVRLFFETVKSEKLRGLDDPSDFVSLPPTLA
jgi:hypothetical protein